MDHLSLDINLCQGQTSIQLGGMVKQVSVEGNYNEGNGEKVISVDHLGRPFIGAPFLGIFGPRAVKRFWISITGVGKIENLKIVIHDRQLGREMELCCKADLKILPSREDLAVGFFAGAPSPDERIQIGLKEWIQDWAFRQMNLSESIFIRSANLEQHIRRSAAAVGLEIVAYIAPIQKGKWPPNYTVPFDYFQEYQINDATIRVRHVMEIGIADERKASYISESIEDWVKRKVDQVTRNALFSKKYFEILTKFDPLLIRHELMKELDGSGLRMKQLSLLPDFEEKKWLDHFYFSTEEYLDHGGKSLTQFVTKDAREKVKLAITVKGNIREFDDRMARNIKPGVNLPEIMARYCAQVGRSYITTVDPKFVYMNFDAVDEDGKSLEQTFMNRIKAGLQAEFNVEPTTLEVTIKPLDTELSWRFNELRRQMPEFEVKDFLDNFQFRYIFQIMSVDSPNGWPIFKQNDFHDTDSEINAITKILKSGIESNLNSEMPEEFLEFRSQDVLEFARLLFKNQIEKIKEQFGLVVVLNDVARKKGYDEELYSRRKRLNFDEQVEKDSFSKQYNLESFQSLMETKKKLQESILRAISSGDLEAVDEAEENLGRVEAKIAEMDSLEKKKDGHFGHLNGGVTPRSLLQSASQKEGSQDQISSSNPRKMKD